jgi:predicted nucleic acid-binding protein
VSGSEPPDVPGPWSALRLVVEAAHRAGATRLVTEDLQPGRAIAGITVENPFA